LISEPVEDRPKSGKRAFLEHYGSTVFGQGLILGLGILTGVLSARMLGPVGRGEYAAINAWPLGIATFFAFGINQAIVFYMGQRTFTVSESATAAAIIGLTQSALSIAVGLIVIPVVLAKYSTTVRHLGIEFVLLTPAVILSVYPANLFQGLQDLPRFNLIRVFAPLIYAAGLIGLYLARRNNLSAVIFWQLFGCVVALVLGVVLVVTVIKPKLQWNPVAIPTLFHFGTRVQTPNLGWYFQQRIEQLFLSVLGTPPQLGLYAVAVTLSTTVMVFPQAAGIVTFSHGSGQGIQEAKTTIGRSFRASLLWLLVCCTAIYIVAPILIRVVFGPAFEGSILACRILLPGAVAMGLNQVLYNGASALGKPGIPSVAEGISTVVTAVGLYLFVPRYGYIGAAAISTVAYTISFLLMLGFVRQLLGLRIRDLLFCS